MRLEIEKRCKEIMDKIEDMSRREFEDAYIELMNACDMKTLELEQMEKVVSKRYGKDALTEIVDSVAKQVAEVNEIKNDESVEITPEQEQILNDLF